MVGFWMVLGRAAPLSGRLWQAPRGTPGGRQKPIATPGKALARARARKEASLQLEGLQKSVLEAIPIAMVGFWMFFGRPAPLSGRLRQAPRGTPGGRQKPIATHRGKLWEGRGPGRRLPCSRKAFKSECRRLSPSLWWDFGSNFSPPLPPREGVREEVGDPLWGGEGEGRNSRTRLMTPKGVGG